MTTKQTISEWYDKGVEDGHMFMFVMCDTYDWDDYPQYAKTIYDAINIRVAYPSNMQKIMEIYDLRKYKQKQLSTHLNMCEIE